MAKAHEANTVKNKSEASVTMTALWPGVTKDVLQISSKGKKFQINKSSLGKALCTWPDADALNDSTRTGVMLETQA